MQNILVVCVGNVCRSPLGERLLQARAPNLDVTSAGVGALVGKPADPTAVIVAQCNGVSLDGHVARQAKAGLLEQADLVLVMESGHKRAVAHIAPHVLGRVMLLGHWEKDPEIPDPYRRSEEFHQAVFSKIDQATESWAKKLV